MLEPFLSWYGMHTLQTSIPLIVCMSNCIAKM